MANIVLNPFSEAETYSDFTEFTANGILKKYDVREAKSGNKYVDLVISDSTGEISGKFFNYSHSNGMALPMSVAFSFSIAALASSSICILPSLCFDVIFW